MRKIGFAMILAVIFTALFSANASAAVEAGWVQTTDIVAFINDSPIRSYNVEGRTAIIAEDLAGYGFNVVWSGTERTLEISLGTNKLLKVQETVVRPNSSDNGALLMPYYQTDIVTCVNGEAVEAYNINGETVILIRSLGIFGEVTWNDETRNAMIKIDSIASISQGKTVPVGAYPGFPLCPTVESTGAQAHTERNGSSYVYDGNELSMEHVAEYFAMLNNLGYGVVEIPGDDENIYFKKKTNMHTVVIQMSMSGDDIVIKLYNE